MADLIDRNNLLLVLGQTVNNGKTDEMRKGVFAGLEYCRQIIEMQKSVEADIDRAAILRLLHEIEDDATTIAYLSDNQQVFDCSHSILDRVELIRKELT